MLPNTTGIREYQLRSGRVQQTISEEATSRTPRRESLNHTSVTGVHGNNPVIETELGITSATITTLEEETVIHHHNEEPPQEPPQSEEQTPIERSRLLGKQIELDLLQDVLEKFLVRRNSAPPLVPLCRLIPNEAIRTVSSQISIFRDTFDKRPYATTGAPFIVSLLRPGKNEYLEVNDVDLQEWGPTWTQVNDEFERELVDSEWMDLKGRKFLVWDGNHRLKAWLPRIREGL